MICERQSPPLARSQRQAMEQLGAAQPLHDPIQVGLADPGEGGGPAEPRESGRARRQRVELHAGAVGDRWALVRLGLDGNGDTRLEGKKPFGLPERHLDGSGPQAPRRPRLSPMSWNWIADRAEACTICCGGAMRSRPRKWATAS